MTDGAATATSASPRARASVAVRAARPEDGAVMRRIARESGGLEDNSTYAYVLLADRFGDATLIAEHGGEPVGYVAALRTAARPDTAFVWQIGVAAGQQGRGIASALLDAVADVRGVRRVEATVAPSNHASRRLFESFAGRRGAAFAWSDGYHADWFGEAHEAERLITIGPLDGGPTSTEKVIS